MHRLFKQRLIFEAHGILSEESRVYGKSRFLTWLLHCWEIIVSSKCDLVIALSIDISRFYKRYARRVELIPVFVDTAAYNVKSRRAEQFKESIFRGKKLVGVIGPFDIKWNESSLDFLEKNINQFDPRITFAIIGRCKRKKMIARTFYTGYLTDFNTFLSHLDAVLVTSTLSTSGPLNKIIEPMACSLPVFTTPEGFVGMDYAKAGKDIVVAKQIDMVRTVNSLIFNESLMTTIGRAARSTVQRYYSLDVNRERLFEITSSLSA
jgi:glycosyltransferase involved in cell wall biosynthesis